MRSWKGTGAIAIGCPCPARQGQQAQSRSRHATHNGPGCSRSSRRCRLLQFYFLCFAGRERRHGKLPLVAVPPVPPPCCPSTNGSLGQTTSSTCTRPRSRHKQRRHRVRQQGDRRYLQQQCQEPGHLSTTSILSPRKQSQDVSSALYVARPRHLRNRSLMRDVRWIRRGGRRTDRPSRRRHIFRFSVGGFASLSEGVVWPALVWAGACLLASLVHFFILDRIYLHFFSLRGRIPRTLPD